MKNIWFIILLFCNIQNVFAQDESEDEKIFIGLQVGTVFGKPTINKFNNIGANYISPMNMEKSLLKFPIIDIIYTPILYFTL